MEKLQRNNSEHPFQDFNVGEYIKLRKGEFTTCIIKANKDVRYAVDGNKVKFWIPGFKINDGRVVPIIFNLNFMDPSYCIGQAILKVKEDGVYAECKLDDTPYANIVRDAIKDGAHIHSSCCFCPRCGEDDNGVLHIFGRISHVNIVSESVLKGQALPFDETSIIKI